MTDDALHKKNATHAANLQQKSAKTASGDTAAQQAAEDFFAVWQDAIRDAATLKDLLPAMTVTKRAERKSDV